jgi:hypothetical protein
MCTVKCRKPYFGVETQQIVGETSETQLGELMARPGLRKLMPRQLLCRVKRRKLCDDSRSTIFAWTHDDVEHNSASYIGKSDGRGAAKGAGESAGVYWSES